MLYRELAPISNEVWAEIDERASQVLKSYLSARKAVRVNGPKGLDYNVITEGRLTSTQNKSGIDYGIFKVQPLVETRVEFEMERWELDNISRGAKDIDYEPLENAMKEIALFEDEVIYKGLESAGIQGLDEVKTASDIHFGKDAREISDAIVEGIIQLRKEYAQGPFVLIVNQEAYKRILTDNSAYPLNKKIVELIGGKMIFSHVADGAYLLPLDHEDLELTIGRDFSVGYQAHSPEKITFFATESFAFRVLDPNLIIKFTV